MHMKRKIVISGPEARTKVLKGVKYAADIVKLTLGPYGRNFASGVRGGPVAISNDGVSLLKEIEGRDEIEDLGVRAVREACTRTNDKVGDGTTTAAVLTDAIVDGLGVSDGDILYGKKAPVELIEQVEKERVQIVEMLKLSAKQIESEQDLIDIAKVSGEYADMAEMIGKAQWQVGPNGTVVADESVSDKDSVEYMHGIRIDNGYTSSRLITNAEKQSLELVECAVILTNKVFRSNLADLQNIFDYLVKNGHRDVVLFGRAFDDAVIGICLKNIKDGSLRIFPLNAPYTWQDEVMEDLAAVLGAKYFNTDQKMNLALITPSDVGTATKVIAKRFECVVTGPAPKADDYIDRRVRERIERLDKQLEGEISPFEKKQISTRRSQMTAGTALIKVGGETEQMRRHRKDKVDDAINAVKAAHQEGTVAGGGLALSQIADSLPDTYLLKTALRVPYAQVMALAPAGFKIEDWVRDPVKVVHTALTHACDIASSLVTTEVAINWEREKPQYVTNVDNKIAEVSDDMA